MVGRNPYKLFSFTELGACIGPIYARCDSCRRYVRIPASRPPFGDRDHRRTTLSCSGCGADGVVTTTEPSTEHGMEDYRQENWMAPARHPAAVQRIAGTSPTWSQPVPPKLRRRPVR